MSTSNFEEPVTHYVTAWKIPENLSQTDAIIYGHKYRGFRLPILKLNPEAFSADYIYESSLSKEAWAATVNAPNFHYFIALSTPLGQQPDPKRDAWVGSACFFGPHDLYTYNMIGQPIAPDSAVNETYWNISSCHVSPLARMGYVFGLVMHAAYDYVNEYTKTHFRHEIGNKPAYFRLSGHTLPMMKNLLLMYQRKGFNTRGMTSARKLFQMRGQHTLANNDSTYSDMDANVQTVIEHVVRTREGPGPHPWFASSDRQKQMMGNDKAASPMIRARRLSHNVWEELGPGLLGVALKYLLSLVSYQMPQSYGVHVSLSSVWQDRTSVFSRGAVEINLNDQLMRTPNCLIHERTPTAHFKCAGTAKYWLGRDGVVRSRRKTSIEFYQKRSGLGKARKDPKIMIFNLLLLENKCHGLDRRRPWIGSGAQEEDRKMFFMDG